MDRLADSLANLADSHERLAERHARLEAKVDRLADSHARLEVKVDTMGGRLSNLLGADYESHVCAYAHRFLWRALGIRAAVLSTQKEKSPLIRLMDEGEEQGLITSHETDEMDNTDLVLELPPAKDSRYAVSEISVTIQQSYISGAKSGTASQSYRRKRTAHSHRNGRGTRLGERSSRDHHSFSKSRGNGLITH